MAVVYLESGKKIISDEITDVKELLEKLGINPVTVLVVKNGRLAVLGAEISKGDKIEILPIVSKG